jgi:hypothetical protein
MKEKSSTIIKRYYRPLAIVLLLISILLIGYGLSRNLASQSTHLAPLPHTTSATVTKVGVMGCLPPTDTAGPQTQVCALGLEQDDGTYYALVGDNNRLISVANGQRAQVTGTLSASRSTEYKSVGTITVITIKRFGFAR